MSGMDFKMDRVRRIRVANTLLAASGGVMLSLELLFGYVMGASVVSAEWLVWGTLGFWAVNLFIVSIIGLGFSEKFKDPSLSMVQMVWASLCCFVCLLTIPRYSQLVYFLLLIIGVFGVFRVQPKSFALYAVGVCISVACVLHYQVKWGFVERSSLEQGMLWLVFCLCESILISLCGSVAILRLKLRDKNSQLIAAIDAKSRFLANMSHEIRTPMNGVIGMLELIEKSCEDDKQLRYIKVAKSSGQSLVLLINDILDFSKIEADKLKLECSPFDIKSIVSELSETFFVLAKQKTLTLITNIDPMIPDHVLGDQVRIRQIFNNLLSNSLKFTEKGQIKLEINVQEYTQEYIVFSCEVADSGIGIDFLTKEKIFESFLQADESTTRKFGGTGLGLAIVKRLCEHMGGDIYVESMVGAGSTFHFSFKCRLKGSFVCQPRPYDGHHYIVLDENSDRKKSLERWLIFGGGSVYVEPEKKSLLGCERIKPENIEDVLAVHHSQAVSAIYIHEEYLKNMGREFAFKLSSLPGLRRVPIIILCAENMVSKESGRRQVFELLEPINPWRVQRVMDESHGYIVNNDLEKESSRLERTIEVNLNSAQENNLEDGVMSLPKVLLVEDNAVNQDVASMLLEDCDVDVDIADDGLCALEKIKSSGEEYKIIFMDCQMPNLDGYQTTQRLRKGEVGAWYTQVPIIAMTANALQGDKDKCLEAGMSDYITKPISFDILEEKVKAWLEGAD